MATPTAADQRNISAHQRSPSRSSGAANSSTGMLDTVQFCDINAPSEVGGDVNFRQSDYVLSINLTGNNATDAQAIPNPRIGDRARCFIVNDGVVTDYYEYHFKPLGANPAAWRRVRYVGE